MAEMGRNFYVKVINADIEVKGGHEILLMAQYKGLATLQQLAMGRVASCIGEQMAKVDMDKDKVDTDKVDKDKVDKDKEDKDKEDKDKEDKDKEGKDNVGRVKVD